MNTLTLIISLIIASNVAVFGLDKFEVSPVLTLLVFGLVLSNNYFKRQILPSRKSIDLLGDLGIIAIMFVIYFKLPFWSYQTIHTYYIYRTKYNLFCPSTIVTCIHT